MSNIEARLTELTQQFAKAILTALRTATVEDLSSVRGSSSPKASAASAPSVTRRRKPGRLPRRSTEELEADMTKVLTVLKKGPLRAEDIKAATKMDRRALPKVLAMALKAKKITRKGEKRATIYTAK